MNYMIYLLEGNARLYDRRTKKDCTDDVVRYIFGPDAKMTDKSYNEMKKLYDFTILWDIDHMDTKERITRREM